MTSKRSWRHFDAQGELDPVLHTNFCAGFDYAQLVTGEVDFFTYLNPWPWDHLPGSSMLREVGGDALDAGETLRARDRPAEQLGDRRVRGSGPATGRISSTGRLGLALRACECQNRRRRYVVDDRKLEVLRAIVSDYVQTREPVGSKALVERHRLDVSPATIRNDMAVLEDEGYLIQPHTSAGRIPTDKGYRLFVHSGPPPSSHCPPPSGGPSPRSWPEQPTSMTSSIGQCGCWPSSPNKWPCRVPAPRGWMILIRHVQSAASSHLTCL